MGLSLSLYTHVLEGEIINEHKVVCSTQRNINKIGEHFVSGCWEKKEKKTLRQVVPNSWLAEVKL